MRNGALLVGAGEETQTLRKDLTQVPNLIWNFIGALPNMICRYLERGKFLNALFAIVSFGIAVGTILGTTRGKLKWGYNSAIGEWSAIILATLICFIGRRFMALN